MQISRRSVFLIGGYDPKSPEAFFRRFAGDLKRFEKTWGVTATMSPVKVSPDGEIGVVDIETAGPNWRGSTRFGFLVFDKVVLKDFSRPLPLRLLKYLAAHADYVASGTFLRMARKAWRFALYFSYPHTMIVIFAALAIAAGYGAGRLFAHAPVAAGVVVALLAFAILLGIVGRRWHVVQLMDLWTFSRDFLRGRRPDAEALLNRFAEAIVSHARTGGAKELLLVGHSTGGGLILDIVARCLEIDPQFTSYCEETAILTLGSTALKLGMHPAAGAFRARVDTLVADPRLRWFDIQCITDMINFYGSNPVADMGLKPRVKAGMPFPWTASIRIKEMMDETAYRRIRWRPFRLHYQYIFGNTRQNRYDFFMICCGPETLADRFTDKAGQGAAAEGVS